MKRIGKTLALALALCVLLSACGGNAASDRGGRPSNPAESVEPDGPGWEPVELPDWPDPADSLPEYGELPGRMEGCFYTGTTVLFDYGAFTASDDGVYFLDADSTDPVLVVSDTLVYDSAICTDGFTVYYVTGSGEVAAASLEDGEMRQVTDGAAFPFHAGIVGAGADRVYVQIPGEYNDIMDMNGLDSVAAVSLETGEILDTWDSFGGSGCAGGCTAIFGQGYDVSPRELMVFDFGGNVVVNDQWTVGASVTGGTLFYSGAGIGADGNVGEPLRLYKVDAESVAPVLEIETDPDDTPYGIFPEGFTALSVISSQDAPDGMLYEVYDLRTGEPLSVPEGMEMYNGYTVDGEAYLVGQNAVYRWRDGEAACIFERNDDLRYGNLLLCGKHILLDGWGGEFFTFPLDPENTVHPIPVTAAEETFEEYDGKNGAVVTASCSVFMVESEYHREALIQSMLDYNEEAHAKTRNNAAACASQASDQIENGFATSNDPFSVSTRSYIQRADTLAFSFVEHQTMDNRVNRAALDIKTGHNYDPADGHALTLDEVVTDEDSLREILLDHLEESGFAQRNDLDEYLFQLFKTRSLTSTDQFSWVLGYEGISFYFNGQVNFPYAQSSYKCAIPFTDAPEIFNSKYLAVPDSYSYDVLLDDNFNESYRVQTKGGSTEIWPSLIRSDDTIGESGEVHVVMDGEDASAHVYGFPVYGTLMHTGGASSEPGQLRTGGENYLLVQSCGNSMALDLLDLNGGLWEAWDFGDAALPQHLPVMDDWDYESWGQKPVHVWASNPDCFSVLTYDLATENYTVRGVYSLNGGEPRSLDLFGASLAVG